jgi:hypothetical protein
MYIHDIDRGFILDQVTFADTTQIGLLPFVMFSPRWLKQVVTVAVARDFVGTFWAI